MIAWTGRRQIPVYIGAMVVGAAIGLVAPGVSTTLETAVPPALMLLLFATFLAVPFATIVEALRDLRFLGAVLAVNFLLIPLVVFGLSRLVAHDRALLVGVLLVLLTPCIDYVVVFTRLAGGSASRLLAVSPVLMLAQLALLPVFLGLFAGREALDAVDVSRFLEAFVLYIAVPLGLAILTQVAARRWTAARVVERTADAAMVPLLAGTLALIVGAQIDAVRAHAAALVVLLPLYVAFLLVAVVLGILFSRIARADVGSSRALVFSGATRNSLVVLPLALALPENLSLASTAVVTQTLVELVGMVVLVTVVPRVVR